MKRKLIDASDNYLAEILFQIKYNVHPSCSKWKGITIESKWEQMRIFIKQKQNEIETNYLNSQIKIQTGVKL